jgi:hypothetical protein
MGWRWARGRVEMCMGLVSNGNSRTLCVHNHSIQFIQSMPSEMSPAGIRMHSRTLDVHFRSGRSAGVLIAISPKALYFGGNVPTLRTGISKPMQNA